MEGYDAELFVPSDFVLESLTFGERRQQLYCLKSATTDYDLTGLIVWPASQVLAWYLCQRRDCVEGKHVLEVGAGCGLVGLIAEQCGAASVTLTDGDHRVLTLLKKSLELNQLSEDRVRIELLEWGNDEAVEKLTSRCEASGSWPTVIVGADVFQTSFGSPSLPFRTVKQLFLSARAHGEAAPCAFNACFALRATTKEDLIQDCAEREGFLQEKICIRDMLPEGIHPDDFTKEKLRLIKYTLKV